MRRPVFTAFLLLRIHFAFADIRSLEYFYTAASGLTHLPEFTAVGLVDGQQFLYFDSDTMTAEPKTERMRENEGADYWERESQTLIAHHKYLQNNIQTIKRLFNQSAGVHTLQLMYGCEMDDNVDSTRRFLQYGYDGEDFLLLDSYTLTWTAASPEAHVFQVNWTVEAEANYWESFLQIECVERLKKYLRYVLKIKVSPPQVSLLQKSSSSSVSCHATGFYPSGITISWMKNGEEHHEDVDLGELLPNADGSFQKTSTLTVGPEEWNNNKFICEVEHQGRTVREDQIRKITNYLLLVCFWIIVGFVSVGVIIVVVVHVIYR